MFVRFTSCIQRVVWSDLKPRNQLVLGLLWRHCKNVGLPRHELLHFLGVHLHAQKHNDPLFIRLAITCSKSTIETLQPGVKYVQS